MGNFTCSEKSENQEIRNKIQHKKHDNTNKIDEPETKNKIKTKINMIKEKLQNKNEEQEPETDNKIEKSKIKRIGDGKEIRVKVKGKVSDIQTLKDFLAKAKAERAERGGRKYSNNANLAEGRTQPTNTIEREGRTQSGENSSDANLEKIGTRILTAKGDQLGGRQL